jgi:hypothetical protein
MSRYKVERLCFALTDKECVEQFKTNTDEFIAKYSLTELEKDAIKNCDIDTLYSMGVITQAISALSRVFGNTNATYVQRLRAAAGLPENKEQLRILTSRGR